MRNDCRGKRRRFDTSSAWSRRRGGRGGGLGALSVVLKGAAPGAVRGAEAAAGGGGMLAWGKRNLD